MHGALADIADHFNDIVRLHATAEPPRAIDVRMRHGPARIRLERERLCHPTRAEIIRHRGEIALGGLREGIEESVATLEHRARTTKSGAAKERGADAGLRRPAGVQPFSGGAFGEIFDDAA